MRERTKNSAVVLGPRFTEAVAWATELHAAQVRKGSGVPYSSHLLAVASLVLEDGGDEDEAIAGLLHDSVEDTEVTVEQVADRFGARVADIVRACSDAVGPESKPPWRERKQAYIDHLLDADTSNSALRVSTADKLHNARSLLADHRRLGAQLWERFNPDARNAETQLWYYDELVRAFQSRRPDSVLTDELVEAVRALHESVAGE